MVEECGRSRVLAGVHFPFSTRIGRLQAYDVSDWVYQSKFEVGKPTPVAAPQNWQSWMVAVIVVGCLLGVAIVSIAVLVGVRVWRAGKPTHV